MKRIIIQLTEEQHRMVKELAAEYHVSVSEMVRRSVDALAQNKPRLRSREEIRRRAMAIVGIASDPSGATDVSINHDKYLEEIYAEENQNDDDDLR
jgi:Arc/MetJ-type ribon-helix-helix transcriptional regulator